MKNEAASTYKVTAQEAGLRLDEFLHKQEGTMPIAAVRRAIEAGDARVNGQARSSGWRLRTGDQVWADLSSHRHRILAAEAIPLEILFEDEHLIAVNKPPFMLSHPSTKERTGTLINALLHYMLGQGIANPRPSLVHRLDRDTSGVIVIAKQERALQKLSNQFNERQVRKVYEAIAFGALAPASGRIDAPIGNHPVLWPRWRVMEKDGKPAQTVYRVKEQLDQFALVELEPLTGRTHQIRIHLAHIGHPILGDHTYGRAWNKQWQTDHPDRKIKRHMLHAAALAFRHPITNMQIQLNAPLPADMKEVLASARTARD